MPFHHPAADILPRYVQVIDGALEMAGSGASHTHIYPATGQATTTIQMSGTADLDRACAAARKAAPAWRAMAGDKRRDLMFKLAAMLESQAADMAPILTAENGSIVIAGPHMSYDAAQKFRYFGGWADKVEGRTVATWGGPAHDYVAYEPYGTIGIIVPWNGPLFAATMVMAPALAAGNCVVIKSPELAPCSVMRLVELIHQAGFPNGVVNLVTGAGDLGAAMVSHPQIDKIEFIGSGATATKILTNAAQSLKPVGLELGGKSAVLVFADANLQDAAKRGLSGAVSANGQGCVNGTRLLVERAIYEPYIQMLAAMAAHVTIGDPFAMDCFMGPVISATALARISGMVSRGVASGARLICGGAKLGGDHAGGYYLPITILADVSPD
ncbi:MAG: hypothetical protein RLY97_836, partial [Pseudomonadota bacterium]